MGKRFFEVFPTLKVDQDLRGLFEETEVTKVTTTPDRRFIRVHLFSHHMIQKRRILELERKIKEQLFGQNMIQIQVRDTYQLSGQYTLENVIAEYWDCLLYTSRCV